MLTIAFAQHTAPLTAYRQGIYTLDAGYERPLMASIHLIVEGGRVAMVDAGVNSSLPYLLRALAQLGLSPESVDYLLLTHVHLDHAGGAGMILRHCPNAQVVVHERGLPHLHDPSKLMAGTIAVYGEGAAKRLYGDIVPIPTERMIVAQDGKMIHWQGRQIEVIDTPGHAKHHVCYFDHRAKAVFSGDTLGISYREMDEPNADPAQLPRQFVLTTTTPVHFDPPVLIESIDKIMAKSPQVAFQTHFGELRNLPEHAENLKQQIHAFTDIASIHADAGERRHRLIREGLIRLVLERARRFGSTLSDETIIDIWASDIDLDAQGLIVWLDSQKKR